MRQADAHLWGPWANRSLLRVLIIMVIGAIISAVGNVIGGSMQNRANAASAQKQMDFQREMSNTAYQRAMADMRLAGLNPILAYKQGGATTPTGTSYQAQNVMGKAVNSAVNAYQITKQVDNTEADTSLKKDTGDNTRMDTQIKKKEDIKKTYEIERAQADVNSAKATARIRNREAEDAEKFGSGTKGQTAATIKRIYDYATKGQKGHSAKSTPFNDRGKSFDDFYRKLRK